LVLSWYGVFRCFFDVGIFLVDTIFAGVMNAFESYGET
jgi:hypothetical protein